MKEKQLLYKIVSFVDREELDFLDKITKDIYFTTGKKVPRAQVIKEIINVSKSINSLGKEISRQVNEEIKKITKGTIYD